MAMRLDIRVRIHGERQTNELRLHPVDSAGQGNDSIGSTSQRQCLVLVNSWRGRDRKVGQRVRRILWQTSREMKGKITDY